MTSGSINSERLHADFATRQTQLAAPNRADSLTDTYVTFWRVGD